MENQRGALEISFGWLFAIVAGIVIIFVAIYFSSKIIGTEQETKSAETGKEIGTLLNPLETGFESAQTTSITIPVDTRINNKCELTGTFGRQTIQLDQRSFNEWTKTDVDVFFYNKYIFSDDELTGKKFYIFSKPFDFPFKVADLIYMTTADDRYCFIDAPDEIEEEISNLNQANLLTKNCSGNEIEVCFNNQNCDVEVDYNAGRIGKGGEFVYFDVGDSALMYAGIFAEKAVYECQLRRLMLRVKELSLLYIDKETISRKNGCSDESLAGDLGVLSELAGGMENSEEISLVKEKAEDINNRNEGRLCRLW
ncbi:MAG: hypothetical protein PHQ66_03480 [Candidatus Nanoarchaeia archaeon]|nr:hypothetical protein [Candidatus Nanoarchaeia archaeon]MDD5357576.1 hypothetical protein [Candidatus Nanoarchaeia archaeon]MDD5588495.1 hypothetical protein [Candidatus Nanoarchaeia archaeon]